MVCFIFWKGQTHIFGSWASTCAKINQNARLYPQEGGIFGILLPSVKRISPWRTSKQPSVSKYSITAGLWIPSWAQVTEYLEGLGWSDQLGAFYLKAVSFMSMFSSSLNQWELQKTWKASMKVGRHFSRKICFSNSQSTYHDGDLPALFSSCHNV